jgi:hypothetical protein
VRYWPNAIPDAAVRAELERISYALGSPAVDRLEFKKWESIPAKPEDGHVYLFAADVVGAGRPLGLYIYLAGAWTQL